MRLFRPNIEELVDLLGDDLPSNKRAAVTVIDLRTRLEIRTVCLTISLAINTALLSGLAASKLF